ncbi:MAG: hypothetical protein ACPGRE_04940 [Flavobacteriaceae bacterium]
MKKLSALFFLILVMLSCALESKYALPNDEKINLGLLGQWYSDEDEEGTILKISKESETRYTLTFIEKGKEQEMTAFSKTIKGHTILNLISVNEGKTTNIFYGFVLKDDELTYYDVNDALKKEDFKSKEELLAFFEKNVSRNDFFLEPIVLKRK